MSGVRLSNRGEVRKAMLAAHSYAAINQDARGADFDDRAARADFVAAAEEGDVHLWPLLRLDVARRDQFSQRRIDRLGVREDSGNVGFQSHEHAPILNAPCAIRFTKGSK